MKNIFPKSIGDLRTLGTRREWLNDCVAIGLGAALFLAAYLFF